MSAAPCAHLIHHPVAVASFVRNSKFVSEANASAIQLMSRCLVQLYSLDPHSAYQHGFVYIRQLALHLRAAINAKTKDAVKNVYCWQYINCLRVRGLVVGRACAKQPLTRLCLARFGPWSCVHARSRATQCCSRWCTP